MSIRQETWPVTRILMVTILITCFILINHGEQSNGLKKLKMIKKIKKALPFLIAMKKPKKKILLLPIPFPMKGKKGGGGSALNLLQGMSSWPSLGSLGSFMAGGDSWGSSANYGNYMSGAFTMVPQPSPPMMMMVPIPAPEPVFQPAPEPVYQAAPVYRQPAPVINYPSNIDNLNNAMMNHAMDRWMMMAAMDCFGMDDQIQSQPQQSNTGSRDHWSGGSNYDKVRVEERQPKQYFRSPVQVVREIPSRIVQRPETTPYFNFGPENVQQKQQHEEEGFDEPVPVKSEKLVQFPIQQQQQQQQPINYSQGPSKVQQNGGQTYFPIQDFSSAGSNKGNQSPVKGGGY